MRVVLIERSTLDYRIPVYDALNNHNKIDDFHVIFSQDVIPERVVKKIKAKLGEHAHGLKGEIRIGAPYDPAQFKISPLRYFHQPGLRKLILSLNPDVMITTAFNHWSIMVFSIRLSHRIPLIMTYERTKHTERFSPWIKTVARKFLLSLIDSICCNGVLCGDYVESLGFPKNRITTGHMVADTAALQAGAKKITEAERRARRMEWKADGIVFLYVGRLIPLKGITQLLEGWALFENQGIIGTLILVGDGPEEEKLKHQATHLGLKNIIFAGPVNYDHIAPFYASADVFVMPTLEDNWSLVVPEAMACGLPILCSKYNGCWPELVHEGKNGWVFDPLNSEDTFRVLMEAAKDQGKLPEMGKVSQEIVSHHSPQAAAQAIYSACEIALKHRQS